MINAITVKCLTYSKSQFEEAAIIIILLLLFLLLFILPCSKKRFESTYWNKIFKSQKTDFKGF